MMRTQIAAILMVIVCAPIRLAAAQDAPWSVRAQAQLRKSVLVHKPHPFPAGRYVVMVRFSVDEGGKINNATVEKSCGKPNLDQAALAAVLGASPLSAPPRERPDGNFAITVPIVFNNASGSAESRSTAEP